MAAGYKPHKKQAEFHRQVLSGTKRLVLLWGRQVGKTLGAVNQGWISGVLKQGRYFIIFPTYKQAKDTVWNQYLHQIPKQLIKETNASELKITLHHLKGTIKLPGLGEVAINHDPELPASTIELKGSDEADRLRGMKADGLIFDEYAIQEPEHWPTVFQPMLSTTDGWAAFISTPKGFNHFYDMVMDVEAGREGWWISKATWRDNPAITPEFINRIKQEADEKGELSAFMQEYELQFRSVEGAVFPEFDRNLHVVPPSKVPKEGTVVAGIDFGWTEDHPTAVNFILIDNDQNWWIYDEMHVSKMLMKDVIEQIRIKLGNKLLTMIVADSARPEHVVDMQSKGMPAVPVAKTKDSIHMGIRLIGQMLKPRIQMVGDPKPKMFVTSNCRNTIYEFEMYKYPSKKKDRAVSEMPMKINDHHMDAIRYVALQMKFGTVEQDKPLKSSIDEMGEYGLLI